MESLETIEKIWVLTLVLQVWAQRLKQFNFCFKISVTVGRVDCKRAKEDVRGQLEGSSPRERSEVGLDAELNRQSGQRWVHFEGRAD